MADHVPYAERLRDEVDAFFDLWKNRRWLAIVFVLLLIVVGVTVLVGWLKRGSQIEQLQTENREQKRDLRQLESENKGLRETVAPLLARAAKEFPGEEINVSLKKIVAELERQTPARQPIASVEGTVQVTIKSDATVDATYMSSGGYAVFAKGATPLLQTSFQESSARQTGKGTVVHRGLFQMAADDPAVGKPLEHLTAAEYIQAEFFEMPTNSRVTEGRIIFVINDSTRLEFSIPEQRTEERRIFIRSLTEGMKPLASNNRLEVTTEAVSQP